ncbi:hypothetical protein [Legionella hackeliae]|uniref:Dot/Icm secretion system substrate n=1 Tax=Legionella hackeliae TaxID=449 RepID=A0A0A8US38_LEGHA|nr:hypothetical protein [Legionella hackeliae]KTD10081.1 Dot/Icm secretion system substrate [Legionella hackeliae]CEK09569.1 conserved protein of unknown function [Legionella hackeliae]STX49479.1 Dot/Icm T4SS effector [Legionella hackeliae]
METKEHKQAGDQIRIETLDNPYLKGSKKWFPLKGDELIVTMMRQVNGVPVPLALELTAGDIVALAGDYYTKAGWGLRLNIPQTTSNEIAGTIDLFNQRVDPKETRAFHEAYSDLASPDVKKSDVEKIYNIEKTTYIPFFNSLNSIFQQLVYALTVKGYSAKLTQNEAHFSPWSARAYTVGHHSALHNAELAHVCRKIAAGESTEPANETLHGELENILQLIKSDPKAYGFTADDSNSKIYYELAHRFHALAVSQDLFTMHFYSDHYAAGHLNRIGLLRKTMPEKFGTWGSILINNMHNEDNIRSVEVINPHQPSTTEKDAFRMYSEDDQAYGDGTYFNQNNAENSNMLVNGMTNSLGDITRLIQNGIKPETPDYGGLCFLPEVDYQKPQTQPMLINGADGKIYFRSNISCIQVLSPEKYQATLQKPDQHGYEELTYWKAFVLVFKLRVLGPIYSPKIEDVTVVELQSEIQNQDVVNTGEEGRQLSSMPKSPKAALWRSTPPAPDALRCIGFTSVSTKEKESSQIVESNNTESSSYSPKLY